MVTHRLMIVVGLLSVLGLWPEGACAQPAWVEFEHRSQLDGDLAWNYAQILAEARQQLLERYGGEWAQHAATSDEKRARAQALATAGANAAAIVKLELRHGPTGGRVGANGYVAGRAYIDWAALDALYRENLPACRRGQRYTVLVLISEYTPAGRSEFSKAAAEIQSQLVDGGSTVINERQFEELRRRKLDYARLDGEDHQLIARLAHDQGAQIILTGTIRAKSDGAQPIGGGNFIELYTADCVVEMVWTATAKTIDGISGPPGRRTYGSAAEALEEVAKDLAASCKRRLATLPPLDELEVVIDRLNDAQFEDDVRAWITEIAGPAAIRNSAVAGRRLSLTVRTTVPAHDFSRELRRRAADRGGRFTLVQTSRDLGVIEFEVEQR